jgi:hypothetical protein
MKSMITMNKNRLLLSVVAVAAASLAGAALVGCSGDDSSPGKPTDGGPDSTMSGDGASPDGSDSGSVATADAGDAGDAAGDAGAAIPPPPALGVQIDRFGRPAMNTALNHAFDPTAAAGIAKDAYNADTDAGAWAAEYSGEFAKNLAILDSLDTTDAGNGCGNQPFAQVEAGAARYATLAGVLANDKMWINTAATSCTQYLGVELLATGVLPSNPDGGPTNECGGRKLGYDVIQTTYSVAAGVGLSGFGSGVSAVASKTSGTTFPYLAAPQ